MRLPRSIHSASGEVGPRAFRKPLSVTLVLPLNTKDSRLPGARLRRTCTRFVLLTLKVLEWQIRRTTSMSDRVVSDSKFE